jgi:hypothetical protein
MRRSQCHKVLTSCGFLLSSLFSIEGAVGKEYIGSDIAYDMREVIRCDAMVTGMEDIAAAIVTMGRDGTGEDEHGAGSPL